MRSPFVCLSLFVLASFCAAVRTSAEVDTAFEMFLMRFKKSYASREELAMRRSVFASNLQLIEERNAAQVAAGYSAVHGVTRFSDLTQAEFRAFSQSFSKRNGGRSAADEAAHYMASTAPTAPNLPTAVDWRVKNAVTPVKDQGDCGSCWAFSVVEEVESNWIISGHEMVALSVQQLVSCDKSNNGCNGGDTELALKYVISAGLETNATFPYTSGPSDDDAGVCYYNASEVVVEVSGYGYGTTNHNETLLQHSVAEIGPMSACVACDNWDTYTNGILAVGCGNESDVSHCVQVVGYTQDPKLGDYWIVRNSWTTDWGVDGYIYLLLGNNTCDITGYTTYAHIKQ